MEYLSKVKFFFVSYISIGRDGEFSMRAKYFYGIVRREKFPMRIIVVLGEGVSLEGQVCSKFFFSDAMMIPSASTMSGSKICPAL